jgi:hypothetical protein
MLLAAAAPLSAAPAPPTAPLGPIPFHQAFRSGPLDRAWQVDVSQDNTVTVAAGGLRIAAAANTYAHIERPLGVDLVRAACSLKPEGGISWVSSLFLYWDVRNWCQVSVLESVPSYYAVQLIDGQLHERRRPLPAKADWYRVAIALGTNCLRFQSSADGRSWTNWLVLDRPENWVGKPPALLVIGKGFSRDEGGQHFLAPDLDNDYSQRGAKTVSWVRDVSVEPTPPAEVRWNEAELKELAAAGRDHLGEAELGAEGDPSFASVSRHFPPLKHPRESLGVKDGPDEFVVLPDGSLDFAGKTASFLIGAPPKRFGEGSCAKRLYHDYLPIVVAASRQDGLQFEETTFGWSTNLSPDSRLFALVRLRISNTTSAARQVPVQFVAPQPVTHWEAEVPAGGEQSLYLRVPFTEPAGAAAVAAAEFDQRLGETAQWWTALLSKGIQIDVPEPRVNAAWRAWLAYNFINVDKRGQVYEPHDGGGGFYEAVFGYSASRYCYALDLMGYPEEAERYLDSLLTFVNPEGLLVVNYGLPDHGTQLWAMAQHFQMTGDAAWLRRVAPTMIKMCDWIIATRKASMAHQDPKAPWHGLIKYRPYCDEPNPAYSFHTDTYLALGMRETAAALRAIGLTKDANRLAQESAAYQKDVLAAMDRAVVERKGMKMLPMFPESRALLERVGYSGADYYDLVGSIVLETGLLPAHDRRARLITDLLEARNGLCLGTCEFQNGIDHAYTYGYWMNCLDRGEIKRVILGLYTSLAYGMSRGTYAGVEVTRLRTGDNYPTLPHLYSGTQQLLLLRNMLLREDGDDLWIGPAIPRAWLEPGKGVRIGNAPTLFGKVSYAIRPDARGRAMTIDLNPPPGRPPKRIYLRLRNPESRPLTRVTLNGREWKDFNGDTVTLTGLQKPAVIKVSYE